MSEEQGQASGQPMDVLGALTAHMQVELGEDKPRDEKGKFAPKAPAEAPKAEEAAPPQEEVAAEEEPPRMVQGLT